MDTHICTTKPKLNSFPIFTFWVIFFVQFPIKHFPFGSDYVRNRCGPLEQDVLSPPLSRLACVLSTSFTALSDTTEGRRVVFGRLDSGCLLTYLSCMMIGVLFYCLFATNAVLRDRICPGGRNVMFSSELTAIRTEM